ncbi:hypothetical protein HYC85_031970 [Camellia sinensis]|uniref:Peptidase A1 domain-containing protein n=1 Tax=Camellia sinensis TaxID=4442 RepID=A0A7J7FSL4_CAMSI|nr:hypothetical protein HYC85_031970 [Camellia sinensis]
MPRFLSVAAGFSILVAFSAVILPAAVVGGGFPAALKLERAFPTSHRIELSKLRERDRVRHRRILQSSSSSGVVDFPVAGTYDPFVVGLYFTEVQLGSPPKDFYVQIDTGSDVLWIPLNFFDPTSSSTASLISCSDQRCALGAQSSDSGCSSQNNQCAYTFQYGDGSGTSGYYVSDVMHLDTIVGNSLTTNSTAPVVFGCSTSQTGDLTKAERAVDGIFGFGQQGLSIISQLFSQGVSPNAFSHCLKSNNGGGGILVLGEIVEPNMVYSPLVPSQPHYNLDLQSIAVDGQTLSIDPSVFTTSNNRGTIVDSGTTLAYLAEEAYGPFVGAGGAAVWCIGFQKIKGQGITILGDLVLKDKIVVYDLAGQRIGWANYDCSLTVNVSATTSTGTSEFVNAGQIGQSSSPQNTPCKLIPIIITAFLLHISAFGGFSFL